MEKIAVLTGATGFIGKRLCLALLRRGYQLRILSRNPGAAQATLDIPGQFFKWDPDLESAPAEALSGAECVFHLAGEPIAEGRWTQAKKRAISSSRILGTRNLVDAIKKLPPDQRPQVLVSSSAIGYYGSRGEETLKENSSQGDSFLAKLCADWEAEAQKAQTDCGVRTAIIRIGIVLGTESGALAKMVPLFRLGLGGRLGLSGKNFMSWIHVDDLVSQFIFCAQTKAVSGVLNGVSPEPVKNSQFTAVLAETLGRPAIFHAPEFALKLILGEMSVVVLSSQKILPTRSIELGFEFRFPSLHKALEDLLSPGGHKGAGVLEVAQWLPKKPKEVFPFFSDAHNLEEITPKFLHFKIDRVSTKTIEPGTLIDYSLRIRGVPVKWRTLIESFKSPESFVDTQLRGPYKLWHHTHRFEEVAGGTLATDRVLYRVGWGVLGDFLELIWVGRDVKGIFAYRKSVLKRIFGGPIVK